MSRVKYEVSALQDMDAANADVYQMAVMKVGLQLATDILHMSPGELMNKYRLEQFDVTALRNTWRPNGSQFPFITSRTPNEDLGELVGAALAAALEEVR